MEIEILDQAERDLIAGYRFYEAQRSRVGEYFLDSLYADIDSLVLFGGMHRMTAGFHRLLSRNFPYAVYYRMRGRIVEVWAVVDCRRNPSWIKRKLTRLRKN